MNNKKSILSHFYSFSHQYCFRDHCTIASTTAVIESDITEHTFEFEREICDSSLIWRGLPLFWFATSRILSISCKRFWINDDLSGSLTENSLNQDNKTSYQHELATNYHHCVIAAEAEKILMIADEGKGTNSALFLFLWAWMLFWWSLHKSLSPL